MNAPDMPPSPPPPRHPECVYLTMISRHIVEIITTPYFEVEELIEVKMNNTKRTMKIPIPRAIE